MGKNYQKSICELEGWAWNGEIPTRDAYSGTECRFYELHNKAICQLDLSDIRFLIGQNSGLKYLVPIALENLTSNIFIEAEYYPGDLLYALLSINNDPNYWLDNKAEKAELIELYKSQKENLASLNLPDDIIKKIKKAFIDFH